MSIEQPTVFVVEDERSIRALLVELLSTEYQVIAAADGREALQKIEQIEPGVLDLILLDVMLPEMDGYQLYSHLRENYRIETIPVLYLTALDELEAVRKGLRQGATDYISKPFDAEILLLKVRNHIRQKHHVDQLYAMSMIDAVTNLYNRRQFDRRFENEWHRCMRSQNELALMMIDVDYFKRYNDCYGHAEGDRCLAQVAHEIRSIFKRSADFVARYGGEEFAVVLPETDLDAAVALAQRLLERFHDVAIPHEGSRSAAVVTVSVGVAVTTPSADSTAEALLVEADQRLYEAKSNGRNCVMPGGKLSRIIWGEHFSVGHNVMDEHHQRLIGYTNELIECVNGGQTSSQQNLFSVMENLRDLAGLHFQSEEALLQSMGYPELKSQLEDHAGFKEILSPFFSSDSLSASDLHKLVRVMRSWWEEHILVEDMAYRAFVEESVAAR